MTRLAFYCAVLAFVSALYFAERSFAGFAQCAAAQTCPWGERP